MTGKLDRRLPRRGTNDDLDRLAAIVNTMLDEIARLVGDVRGVCAGPAVSESRVAPAGPRWPVPGIE